MATVILVRHGRTTANASGMLAGRTPGVELDDVGTAQAISTAARLAAIPLAAVIASPLERCAQTAGHIMDAQAAAPTSVVESAITECDYGDWQGQPLSLLSLEPLWSVVQAQPSAATFPGGESLAAMQARSVGAIRVWVAVSHGDIIKSVLADALGMHLDLFQRITVAPASVSIIRYGSTRPTVFTTNSDAGDLSWLKHSAPAADAPVGGGAGHQPMAPAGS
jgi:probable phosphomutase (TIGR03848 family)